MSNIINKLRELFCRYGGSKTLVTDNEPQFASNATFNALIKKLALIIENLHLIFQRTKAR